MKFYMIADMFAAMQDRQISPGDQIGCDHCDWTGPTNRFGPHLLTCDCTNLAHSHRVVIGQRRSVNGKHEWCICEHEYGSHEFGLCQVVIGE